MEFRVVFFNPSTDDPIFCSKTVDSSNNVITKMRSDRWVKHKNEQKIASGRLGICHISVALFFFASVYLETLCVPFSDEDLNYILN